MEECRQAEVYGVRPARTFEQAAAKFILESQHKRSLRDDISRIKGLVPWIGVTGCTWAPSNRGLKTVGGQEHLLAP